jgi:hypothetical protein
MAYTTNSGSSNNTSNIDNFLDKFIAKADNIKDIEIGKSDIENQIENIINPILESAFDTFAEGKKQEIKKALESDDIKQVKTLFETYYTTNTLSRIENLLDQYKNIEKNSILNEITNQLTILHTQVELENIKNQTKSRGNWLNNYSSNSGSSSETTRSYSGDGDNGNETDRYKSTSTNKTSSYNSSNIATRVIKATTQDDEEADGVGATEISSKGPDTGHNEYELAKNDNQYGDELYTVITYSSEGVEETDEVFDPLDDRKQKYKNKDIEYRDKNRQVHDAVMTILDGFKDTQGEAITKNYIRGLERNEVPNIMYLITKTSNLEVYKAMENITGWPRKGEESPRQDFAVVNTKGDITGIHISKDKEKKFKNLLDEYDVYTKGNKNKLIKFLNSFWPGTLGDIQSPDGSNSIDYINKLIDIGTRKGKTGRMQLIETRNITNRIKKLEEKNDFTATALETDNTIRKARTRKEALEKQEQNLIDNTITDLENSTGFFAFLADINNDGKVDQFDLSSAMTGLQIYSTLQQMCDTKRNEYGWPFEIINSPQTSVILTNLLKSAAAVSSNSNIKIEIDKFLKGRDFVHTKHVMDFIKKYPELKMHMIINIQAQSEYAQSTRSINNTYEALNTDITTSLSQTQDTDIISDYFTSNEIRQAMGDLERTNIQELYTIMKDNGFEVNRKLDADVLNTMNIFMNTLFFNFGPMMRYLQYDRGDAQIGTKANINLQKHINTPRSEQETRKFIKKNKEKLQERSKNIAIQPTLGFTKDGKTILGLGFNIDKIKNDPSQPRARHNNNIGASLNIPNGELFVGLNQEHVRQVNKIDINSKKPYVKGLGLEISAAASANTKNRKATGISLGMGPVYEVDHLAGLEQAKYNFDKFLSPFIKSLDNKFFPATTLSQQKRNRLYTVDLQDRYFSKFPNEYKQYKYRNLVDGVIHMFVENLQQQRVLENLAAPRTPALTLDEKQKIIQAFMSQRTDGFLAQLYQAELAKLNTKGAKISKIGLTAGLNLTPEALLNYWPIGALIQANIKIRAFNEIYGDDIHDLNSVSKQLDYGSGMKSLDIAPGSNLDTIAATLDKALAIKDLEISVDNWTLILSNSKEGSVLDLLHLYYTPEALEKNKFSFDGKELKVGDVGQLGIASVTKGLSKAHYLILGSDKMIGAIEHNIGTKTDEGITREALNQTAPTDSEGNEIPFSKMQSKEYKVLPTITKIYTQIDTIKDTTAETNIKALMESVDKQGRLVLNPKNISYTIDKVNGLNLTNEKYIVPATGKLIFEASHDYETYNISYSSTPDTDLKIVHNTMKENPKRTTEKTITLSDTLPTEIQTIHDAIEDAKEKIKTFDNINTTPFFEFLASAQNISTSTWDITIQNYKDALTKIKEPLIKHLGKQHETLKKQLNITDLSDIKTVYLVNRLKAIFADNNYKLKNATNITGLLTQRKDIYKNLLGPSGKIIPDEIATIREWFKNKTEEPNPTTYHNILGYTAWYKKGGEDKWARGYSSTSYGNTNILSGFMQEISDKKDVINWTIENIEKDKENLNLIRQQINALLEKNNKLTSVDQLLGLIKNGSIPIDNWNKKLKIEWQRFFYLLAECANESVGFKIENITIQKLDSQQEQESITIKPNVKQGYNIALNKSVHSIDIDVKAKQGETGARVQAGMDISRNPVPPSGTIEGGINPPGGTTGGIDGGTGWGPGGTNGWGETGGGTGGGTGWGGSDGSGGGGRPNGWGG